MKPSTWDRGYTRLRPWNTWPIAFWWTAGGFGIDDSPASGEPTWTAHDDVGLVHSEMHNHGKSYATIALRHGRWVVLREEDYNSRQDPDTVVHEYATASGTCRRRCPPLAKHSFPGGSVMLGWPAHSIAELTPPGIDALNIGDTSKLPVQRSITWSRIREATVGDIVTA